jgi:hypothetical protein
MKFRIKINRIFEVCLHLKGSYLNLKPWPILNTCITPETFYSSYLYESVSILDYLFCRKTAFLHLIEVTMDDLTLGTKKHRKELGQKYKYFWLIKFPKIDQFGMLVRPPYMLFWKANGWLFDHSNDQ